ncbi:hypothetical protein NA56DRAFT_750831 [Hyaloscypha hepaticicola]|uniref:Uncharacterized protein n=1 Tax=Hyaloscypha hepaticicola TaxID=2082293 RepID=A0A2J6PY50_9HELO|nr:hypothetical protein NA56DRAFT_750831 [Hyaloscypha hepaticicola]
MGNGQWGLTTAGRPHAVGSSRLLRAKPCKSWTDGGVICDLHKPRPPVTALWLKQELLPLRRLEEAVIVGAFSHDTCGRVQVVGFLLRQIMGASCPRRTSDEKTSEGLTGDGERAWCLAACVTVFNISPTCHTAIWKTVVPQPSRNMGNGHITLFRACSSTA